MAVPKRKTSKARRDSRRSSTWKLALPGIVECPQCHEPKLAHRVCKKCGFYDGKQVVKIDDKTKKAEA
ncbi:MAG: 50S ribosomal protein L32 [Clostridia bacterium]